MSTRNEVARSAQRDDEDQSLFSVLNSLSRESRVLCPMPSSVTGLARGDQVRWLPARG